MRSASYQQMRKRLVANAKEKKRPVLAHFELTARCNLDCKMCYVHTQDNADALRRELSTQQWIRIFDEAYENDMVYASLSGGECLLRKDFKELYLHLWNKHVYVSVLTNGTLITPEYVEFFKTYRPDMIQISLYGSNEDAYIRVTGHKGFEKTIAAISALQKAGIDVRVAVTPSKYMGDDFIEIFRLCKEKGFYAALMDIMLVPNRDDPGKDDYFLTEDEIVALSVKRSELFSSLVPLDSVPEPCGRGDQPPMKGSICNAGTCLATVTWDGMMYPCFNAMFNGVSLLEHSYGDAWNLMVRSMSEIVQGIECVDCVYNKTCPKCPLFRLKDLHSGHCNPAMCSLTCKLVAAGVKKIEQNQKDCD